MTERGFLLARKKERRRGLHLLGVDATDDVVVAVAVAVVAVAAVVVAAADVAPPLSLPAPAPLLTGT